MCCANELVVFITGVAVAIAEGKATDDLSLMAAAFTQLGDTLATIAAQRAICEDPKNTAG